MTYDIYFHDDFDGRASAAVMLDFLAGRGDRIAGYFPVEYDLTGNWSRDDFFTYHNPFGQRKNPAIVVDFRYHPAAAFWFDHHVTPFTRADWQKHFRAPRGHYWDASYPSCCHLVLDALKRDYGYRPSARIPALAKWLDVIDGANYASARQTIEMKEPALQIGVAIGHLTRRGQKLVWLIKLLPKKPLPVISRDVRIRRAIREVRRHIQMSLRFYKNNLQIVGRVAFIDLRRLKEDSIRFAPYYLHPDIPYGIRLKKKGKLFHFSVGVNPWRRRKASVDIGRLLARYGGGGHRTVGGLELQTEREVKKVAAEIINLLNHDPKTV